MNTTLIILLICLGLWLLYKVLNYRGGDVDNYNRNIDSYDKGEKNKSKSRIFSSRKSDSDFSSNPAKKQGFFARLFSVQLPFDDEAITWCANFLIIEKDTLIGILRNTSQHYSHFKISKRSGGVRIISAPSPALMSLQKTIYKRILVSVNIHPAATGFRPNTSIVQNAKAHLGKSQILKVDITNFFGSIKKRKVIKVFENIGYPHNISQVLAELCTLDNKLPQGAPTSPVLSNIIASDVDVKLAALSQKKELSYTRYADDLTFSGSNIDFETTLAEIDEILFKERFIIQRKKTRQITEKRRKIVTGISISSGEKMTIPKSTKRELRKNVYFIQTKGLAEHQRFIGLTDPTYLKRIIGQLSFWHMVEPDNDFVKKSLSALKKL